MRIAKDSAAFLAESQKLDVVVVDKKIVLFCQAFFCFPDQLELFLDEIAIIVDLPAPGADEVVVMVLSVLAPELVPTLAVTRTDFFNEPQPIEQFQGAVDGGQADSGILGIQQGIDFLSALVL
jgi:hypothetical protein